MTERFCKFPRIAVEQDTLEESINEESCSVLMVIHFAEASVSKPAPQDLVTLLIIIR